MACAPMTKKEVNFMTSFILCWMCIMCGRCATTTHRDSNFQSIRGLIHETRGVQYSSANCAKPQYILSIQYVYYFSAYQRQRTLHGVGVITKLYFAIFAAFKESMTLNLAARSEVILQTPRSKLQTVLTCCLATKMTSHARILSCNVLKK